MTEEKPDSFLLGEVWEDGSNKIAYSQRRRYLLGSETHGLMNYPFRTAILDEIYKSYVRTARAKGLSGPTILLKHVLRNSLIPIVTYIALSIPYLFTGSLMLETFFGIPGLGNVSLNAIHSADMAVVRAVVALGALLYQGVNLVTDLLYAWLDPRVRLG